MKASKMNEKHQLNGEVIEGRGGRDDVDRMGERPKVNYPIIYSHTHIHKAAADVLRKNRVLGGESEKDVINAYKLLRTQVLKKLIEHKWNSVGVLGAHKGDGSTLTAINLAICIALEFRHTVILVDFNLRDPSVHQYFDYEPEHGLSDFLTEGVPISDMLFTPNMESLVVLPGRQSLKDSSERLNSERVSNLVQEIKSRYPGRIVIFDLPPVLESDDAIAFMDHFDAGLLVVKDGVTKKTDISVMSELFGVKPMLGTVFNDFQ